MCVKSCQELVDKDLCRYRDKCGGVKRRKRLFLSGSALLVYSCWYIAQVEYSSRENDGSALVNIRFNPGREEGRKTEARACHVKQSLMLTVNVTLDRQRISRWHRWIDLFLPTSPLRRLHSLSSSPQRKNVTHKTDPSLSLPITKTNLERHQPSQKLCLPSQTR